MASVGVVIAGGFVGVTTGVKDGHSVSAVVGGSVGFIVAIGESVRFHVPVTLVSLVGLLVALGGFVGLILISSPTSPGEPPVCEEALQLNGSFRLPVTPINLKRRTSSIGTGRPGVTVIIGKVCDNDTSRIFCHNLFAAVT